MLTNDEPIIVDQGMADLKRVISKWKSYLEVRDSEDARISLQYMNDVWDIGAEYNWQRQHVYNALCAKARSAHVHAEKFASLAEAMVTGFYAKQ